MAKYRRPGSPSSAGLVDTEFWIDPTWPKPFPLFKDAVGNLYVSEDGGGRHTQKLVKQ